MNVGVSVGVVNDLTSGVGVDALGMEVHVVEDCIVYLLVSN